MDIHYKNVRRPFSSGSSGGRYFSVIDNRGVPEMKRLVLAAVAASMLAMPVMQAQAAPLAAPSAPQSNLVQADWKKPVPRYDRRHDRQHMKRNDVRRPHWQRGQKYSDWRRHNAVRDYHRHGLRRPGPGQEWIRVGNDYLLIGIMTGVIAGIAAAH
jgi:Ni/Co efflux regulator RcnB